jgi:glycosyltransferase involved in cell wall biosynthesis
VAELAGEARAHGVRRIHVLGWRDLDDPEAGGSEVHADHVMRRWAEAGLEVVHRTSAAAGHPAETARHGYRAVRRGGRYDVFPRAAVAELARRLGPWDAVVEIWNGVPWFSPAWARRRPHVVWLHHVHGPMWDQVFPRPIAAAGRFLELRLAPPVYRRSEVITLAEASRDELVHLGFRPERVHVVPPGVDPAFTTGGSPSPAPLVVAVGRLAPVKRFDELIPAVATVRASVPGVSLVIVGEGPERERLEGLVRDLDAGDWVSLPGRLALPDLIALYQRAWVATSASLAEGWGMVLTEAAACGVPAVATDLVGHRGAVREGDTGLLVPDPAALAPALTRVLTDHDLRARLAAGATAWASSLRWDRTAAQCLAVLVDDARRRS